MNFKGRIRTLERKIFCPEGMNFLDLLEPTFKYKGIPFDSIEAIYKHFHLVEEAPYYTLEQYTKLYENGLLSDNSPEVRELKERTAEEMRKNM